MQTISTLLFPGHEFYIGVGIGNKLRDKIVSPKDMEFGALSGPFENAPFASYDDRRIKKFNNGRHDSMGAITPLIEKHKRLCDTVGRLFGDMLTDYDRKIILPSTTALGSLKPTHFELEEKGYLGRNNEYLYDPVVIEQTIAEYLSVFKRHLSDITEDAKSMSLPRGKNIGWPTPIGGMDRALNDFLLLLAASLSQRFYDQGDLASLTNFLSGFHGLPFMMAGSRYQHTEKVIPLGLKGAVLVPTVGFEPRHRAIYMSGKTSVAFNRKGVKLLLKGMLRTDWHNQDRAYLTKTLNDLEKRGFHIFSVDVSKFDQAFGGRRGLQTLDAIGDLASRAFKGLIPSQFSENIKHEFTTPLVSYFKEQTLIRRDAPITPSGVSTTTIQNCFGNRLSVNSVMRHFFGDDYQRQYGKKWFHLGWGDDMVIAVHSSEGDKRSIFKKISEGFEKINLIVDEEPCTRYLGTIYGRGNFAGSIEIGYPLSRFIQLQFFPERVKKGAVAVIGYIARILMLKSRGPEVHKRMLSTWESFDLGRRFSFSEIPTYLEDLVRSLELNATSIAEVDNLIMSLTDGSGDLGAIDIDFDDDLLDKLVALGSIDVSNVPDTIAKHDLEKLTSLKPLLLDINDPKKNISQSYEKVLIALTSHFKLSWSRGSVLY